MNLLKLFKHLMLDQFMFYGGGKGGGGSAPTYPDPTTVANATTATNTATAAYNKALNGGNYNNAFGTSQQTQTGTDPTTGAPIYSQQQSANPDLQGLLNNGIYQASQTSGINNSSLNGLQGLQSQYSGLNAGLNGLEAQYNGLNSGLSDVGTQYQGINSNLSGLGSQYQGINSNLSGLGSQYQGLNSGISGLQNQFSGLNSGISQLGGQYSNLSGQLAGINSSINPNAGAQAQQQGTNAAYAAQTQYLDPQFKQQQESLDNSLANQGLAPGSQAYNNAQLNQSNAKQQAYSNASNQAILTGSTIGQQSLNNQLNAANTQAGLVGQQGSMVNNQAGLFGLQGNNLNSQASMYGQQGSNLGAQAGIYGQQSSNLGAQAGVYGQQSSNLGAQAGIYGQQGANIGAQASNYGQQGANLANQATNFAQQSQLGQLGYQNLGSAASLIPGYTGSASSSAAPADIAGLYNNQYQSQLAGYNASQSSSNSAMSGLFGLGSSALLAYGMSDRRAKRAIKRVATFPNGLGVYTYRYMWEKAGVRHIGFMADEVRKIAPRAVLRFADGFDRVNYQLAAA